MVAQSYYFDGRTEWDTYCVNGGVGWHGEVRNFNEMRDFLRAEAYYEDRIAWATARGEYSTANDALRNLKTLRQAHHDYITGELELEELPHAEPPKEDDPLYFMLLTLSMLAGRAVELTIFDPSDHYSI